MVMEKENKGMRFQKRENTTEKEIKNENSKDSTAGHPGPEEPGAGNPERKVIPKYPSRIPVRDHLLKVKTQIAEITDGDGKRK